MILSRSSSNAGRLSATLCALAALLTLLAAAGCGNNDQFAKVNGQVITYKEHVRALERQTVTPPGGGQPTNALRMVMDQLIGQKVILAEAAKKNLVPTDAAVEAYFKTQKKLFEGQYPSKEYEKAMGDQGTTPEDMRKEFKFQLAEAALYASRLGLADAEVQKTYDDLKKQNGIGFPERYQLRLILVAANSPSYAEAKRQLDQKKKFETVASQVNSPLLKATGGLMQQAVSAKQVPAPWVAKIAATSIGAYFGPVDAAPPQPNQPATKAWVLVEKKLPKMDISFEEAKPLVQRNLVMQRMMQPENAGLVNEIKNQKMAVKFEAADKQYESVWNNLKETAKTGMAQTAGAPLVPPPPGSDMPTTAPAITP